MQQLRFYSPQWLYSASASFVIPNGPIRLIQLPLGVLVLVSQFRLLAIAENKNAIVASCWSYFTTIKHDARNHKY